jgi:biopolymer transport protein ExbB
VFEMLREGGAMMVPILLCSVIALAIALERFWVLRKRRVAPAQLVPQIWHWSRRGELDAARINLLRSGSPLGRVLAAGLSNMHHSREVMKESIEETGRHVVHELERYLNALGTIAAITPFLGLLGTVIGIREVFDVIASQGVGDPRAMAPGISKALITTIAGLSVAIPSVMFYRYFRGRVDELVVTMEQEALKMVEVLHGEREREAESA